MTGKEVCSIIAHHLGATQGLHVTPLQVWTASPIGELYHVFDLAADAMPWALNNFFGQVAGGFPSLESGRRSYSGTVSFNFDPPLEFTDHDWQAFARFDGHVLLDVGVYGWDRKLRRVYTRTPGGIVLRLTQRCGEPTTHDTDCVCGTL